MHSPDCVHVCVCVRVRRYFTTMQGAMQASLPLSWMDDMKFAEHTVDPSRLLPGVELFSDPYRCDAVALSHDLVWLCRTLIDAGYLNQVSFA